jgi:hypothetical protein
MIAELEAEEATKKAAEDDDNSDFDGTSGINPRFRRSDELST